MKYHNHKPQTTLWLREEEPLNHHGTPGRQIKQSNQLSLPHQVCSSTVANICPQTPPLPDPGVGVERSKSTFFQNFGMLHINLKGMTHAAVW